MPSTTPLSRRRLLGLAALGGTALAAGVGGCTASPGSDDPRASRERASCVPSADLSGYRSLADLPLVYEISQRRTSFRIDEGFAAQLETWVGRLTSYGIEADQLWTYGTWTDGGQSCTSWHNAGRAFDLARIRQPGRTFLSCRYDQWGSVGGAALDRARRNYWAVAAGLHHDFAYVLTYLYDANHHNHIHVDNGRSGSRPPTFEPRSGAQVQAVQAICTYLWATPVELTGVWDGPTRSAVDTVLAGLQAPEDLTEPAAWAAFTAASAARRAD